MKAGQLKSLIENVPDDAEVTVTVWNDNGEVVLKCPDVNSLEHRRIYYPEVGPDDILQIDAYVDDAPATSDTTEEEGV